MRNLAECTKLGGYFIGTAYDGKTLFKLLNKKSKGESLQIYEDGKKIWEVVKNYSADSFDDDASSMNYQIDVYQESINNLISEYLINFDYLDRVMENYGFKLISRDEAKSFGLPDATGMFSDLYMNMLEEIKITPFKKKDYGKAVDMTAFEKKISFLNRYFVYKKVIMVNAEKVQLELGEYNEMDVVVNAFDTQAAIKISKQQVEKSKPVIKKLHKKLLLVNATEALDDEVPLQQESKEVLVEYEKMPANEEHEPVIVPEEKSKKVTKTKEAKEAKERKPAVAKIAKTKEPKKKIVVVDDDDSD
jgi:hypothetical protein